MSTPRVHARPCQLQARCVCVYASTRGGCYIGGVPAPVAPLPAPPRPTCVCACMRDSDSDGAAGGHEAKHARQQTHLHGDKAVSVQAHRSMSQAEDVGILSSPSGSCRSLPVPAAPLLDPTPPFALSASTECGALSRRRRACHFFLSRCHRLCQHQALALAPAHEDMHRRTESGETAADTTARLCSEWLHERAFSFSRAHKDLLAALLVSKVVCPLPRAQLELLLFFPLFFLFLACVRHGDGPPD